MNRYDKHCICTVSISADPHCKNDERVTLQSGNNEIFLLVF